MKRLEHKVAVITGASCGIGAGCALRFAQEGADVVLVARRKDRLEENAQACRAYGVRALAVAGDLTDPATAVRVFDETIQAFGRVDILVNNAGIADKHIPITRCSNEWFDEVYRPGGGVLLRPGGAEVHGAGGEGQHRQHLLHRRRVRQRGHLLLRGQGRSDRHDQEHRHPVRGDRHPLQLCQPWPHPYRAEHAGEGGHL